MKLLRYYITALIIIGQLFTLSSQTVMEIGIGTHYHNWFHGKSHPSFPWPEEGWELAKAASLSLRIHSTKRAFVKLSVAYNQIERRTYSLILYHNYTDLYKSGLLAGDICGGMKFGIVSVGLGYSRAKNLNESRTFTDLSTLTNPSIEYEEPENYSKNLGGYTAFLQCHLKNLSLSLAYRRLFNRTSDTQAYQYFSGIKSVELKLNYGIVLKKKQKSQPKEGCNI